jgi:hypothetical protein
MTPIKVSSQIYFSNKLLFFIIHIESNIKRKKLNINTISKGQFSQNNNSNSRYDIYDINNFCSNTMKIKEKSISHNVIVPSYKELPEDFFEDNKIEVSHYY